MKKLLIAVLLLVTITTSAFSRTPNAISNNVLSTFNKTYSGAKEVKWTVQKDFVKVSFVIEGQTMYAYYKDNGDQLAVLRNIAISQLPINLGSSLRAKFTDSWMTELFEVSSEGTTSYYATVENATSITVLKAEASGNWVIFKKDKRDGQ